MMVSLYANSALKNVLFYTGFAYRNVHMHVVHVDEGDRPDKNDIAPAH